MGNFPTCSNLFNFFSWESIWTNRMRVICSELVLLSSLGEGKFILEGQQDIT